MVTEKALASIMVIDTIARPNSLDLTLWPLQQEDQHQSADEVEHLTTGRNSYADGHRPSG
jgi:hypothetical protein